MPYLRASAGAAGGGSNAEWITPTVSGTTITCTWDYDAETIIVCFTGANVKHIIMINSNNTSTIWYTNASAGWSQRAPSYGGLTITVTNKRQLQITCTFTPYAVSVLPIENTPNGY